MENLDKVVNVINSSNDIYDDKIVTDIDSLQSDLTKVRIGKRILLKVVGEDVTFDFLLHIKNSEKMLCLGSGAYDSSVINDKSIPHDLLVDYVSIPKFDRQSWDFKYSVIWYNDNTRYLMKDDVISAGWNVGNDKNWHLKTVGGIIKTISGYFGYTNDDVLYYGSSLGGFMSIILAAMNKSRFIADCPQLDLETWIYIPKHQESFEKLFGGESMKNIYKKYPHRFKVVEFLRKCEYIPDGIINITLNDKDINTQYVNFLNSLKELYDIFKDVDVNYIRVNILLSLEHTFLRMPDAMKMIDDVFENSLSKTYKNIY